jgi:ribosomal protein L12E/L44/L45/RPP1/RPP2
VQQRRLHKESQPLEQLDEVIEEIRRLMLSSAAETASNEKLSRREPARAAGQEEQCNSNSEAEEQMDSSKGKFGIQVDFNTGEEELMIKRS